MPENLCVLVDGSSYLYRAYHAMPNLTNDHGEATGAIYGVVNMLKSLLKQYPEDALIGIIFDPKGPTTRHKIYPEYKANRGSMPEDLVPQIAPIHGIIKALGLPLLTISGEEADDVIGTITKQAVDANYDVVISTGDKDLAQLVAPGVELINTMTNTKLDKAGVKAKFGVTPDQIIDYLALIGDSSDNIPGIPKVGPKTAAKWLVEYGNIKNLLACSAELRGKVAQNLVENLETLALAQRLVTIDTAVDLGDFNLELLQRSSPDYNELAEYYKHYGFRKYFQEIKDLIPVTTKNENIHYKLITKEDEFQDLLEELTTAKVIAVDTETTSLDVREAKLVGICLSVKEQSGYYIPLAHSYPDVISQLAQDYVLEELRPYLTAVETVIVGQNIKYDYQVLLQHGLALGGHWFDTMLLSYVSDSSAGRHNLTALAARYLDYDMLSFEDVAGRGKDQVTFDKIELAKACQYAAEDADISLRLYNYFWPLMQANGLADVYLKFEQPLIKILADMELAGVLLDTGILEEQGRRLASAISKLEDEVHILAGEEFNLASTKQLRYVLFEKLGLPILKKTPNKQPATSEEVLKALSGDHEIAAKLLVYRGLTKLQSTYVEKLPRQVDSKTRRIHCSYNQAVTVTGRLSSTDPNLQNIPIKNDEGRRIRQAFIAPQGKKLIAADYSQIELRIMAHLSADDTLLEAFAQGKDIHTATAAEVFEVSVDNVSDAERRHAKAINFGLIYGMSAFGLAKQIEVPRSEAQLYIDKYFKRYPGVKAYMDSATELVKAQGYVETIFGRRLYLPGIKDKNALVRKAAERAAINAPMQGSAADIIKLAMQKVVVAMSSESIEARLLMQVHDELVFEVREEQLEQMKQIVISAMTTAVKLKVPLEVSIASGLNWDQAH